MPRFLLRVNGGLVHQHDGDVVAHRINASALITLQSVTLFRQRGFADRTDQNLEKTFVDHFGNFTPNANDLAAEISLHSACISHLRGEHTPDSRELRPYDRILGSSSAKRGRMTARILDGNKIATEIKAEVAAEIRALSGAGVRPGLAVVLVGHNPASEIYVRGKVKSSEELGIYSEKHTPPETASTEDLLELVHDLNTREEIDGILIQLPLPSQVDSKKVLMAVDPAKDVDGFHPMNVGFLSTQRPGLVPCTPAGIMEILKRSNIPVAGQEAVVVGRSDIVGKPTAMLLMNANATVTVCHSKTRDLPGVCRRADILVAAIGRAAMVTRDFVKPGATVIDVGMNSVKEQAEFDRLFKGNEKREQTFKSKGSTLIGDVHPEVAEVAGAITPVPGGVGPLTIAMLMANTVRAMRLRRGSRLPELSKVQV